MIRSMMIAISALLLASSALAQEQADLVFNPTKGDEFYYTTIASTLIATKDRPGAIGMIMQRDERFMIFRGEILDVAANTGVVQQLAEFQHLRIEIERPGWNRNPYDSNLPKRAPVTSTRKMDRFVNRMTQLSFFSRPNGQVHERLYVNGYLAQMHDWFTQFEITGGSLESLRDNLTDFNITQSFGAGLNFLSGNTQIVGDTWQVRSSISIPYAGIGTITWTCTLEEIEGGPSGVAIISAVPTLSMDAIVPQGNDISMEVGTSFGEAMLRFDLAAKRPVFLKSAVSIPINIAMPNPLGGQDKFVQTITLGLELEEIGKADIPPKGQAGGREWMERH